MVAVNRTWDAGNDSGYTGLYSLWRRHWTTRDCTDFQREAGSDVPQNVATGVARSIRPGKHRTSDVLRWHLPPAGQPRRASVRSSSRSGKRMAPPLNHARAAPSSIHQDTLHRRKLQTSCYKMHTH